MPQRTSLFCLCLWLGALAAPCWAQSPTGASKGLQNTSPDDPFLNASKGAFSGTAYAKTRHTTLAGPQAMGPGQAAAQALLNQCNAVRAQYPNLPPNGPAPESMAALDTRIQEKYLDTDKALTVLTSQRLMLPDLSRWYRDEDTLRKEGRSGQPDTPPDCSQTKLPEIKTGWLWRDGKRFELRFVARKADGSRVAPQHVFQPLVRTGTWRAAATVEQGETRCRMVTLPQAPDVPLRAGPACLWDRFPPVAHLNWPFVLAGQAIWQAPPHSSTPHWIESIDLLEAWTDRPIPKNTFDIPADWTIMGGR